jgi:hypothetical protein
MIGSYSGIPSITPVSSTIHRRTCGQNISIEAGAGLVIDGSQKLTQGLDP